MKGNNVAIMKLGKILNIAEENLSIGDILLLQAGDLVLADARLTEANGLEVDEFDLTGEILAVEKKVDREDVFVYRGSKVTRGNGKGIVTAIGEKTEYGEILKQQWGQVKYTSPPLIKTKFLFLPVFLLPPIVISALFYGGLFLSIGLFLTVAVFVLLLQNNDLFKFLIVSSEIKEIKKQKIQLRDETSFESMGRVDIVCFDKTGVLTTRDIEVKSIQIASERQDLKNFASDNGVFGLTNIACALCNEVVYFERLSEADPIDRALISFAMKNHVSITDLLAKYRRIYDKPFDSEDRYMVCGFEKDGKKVYFSKGDPEVILRMCEDYVTILGTTEKINLNFLSGLTAKDNSVDQRGDRLIALAYSFNTLESPPSKYTFLCILQLENPADPKARETVEALKKDGVRSLILTGDRPESALKVNKEIGLDSKSDYVLTGKTMERMDLSEVAKQIEHTSVFARLLPSQKSILITCLQQKNKSVVMVGDGANGTIALKVADVGISFVENSSPFAKRASKILINNLTDLLTIIRSAKRTTKRIKYLRLSRILVLTSLSTILYLYMINLLFANFL